MARKNKKAQKTAPQGETTIEDVAEVIQTDELPETEAPIEDLDYSDPEATPDEAATVEDEGDTNYIDPDPQLEPADEALPDEPTDEEEFIDEADMENVADAMETAQQLYDEAATGEDEEGENVVFHISVGVKEFKRLLQIADKFVRDASNLPVLGTVLIEAKTNGVIEMSANCLDHGLMTVLAGKVNLAGSICIPHKVLFDIVKAMPANTSVEITADSRNKISLVYGPLNTLIHGIAAEEMPRLPLFPATPTYSFLISATTVARVSKEVQPFTALDEARPLLTGSHWKLGNGRLEVAATDGFRLALLRREHRSPLLINFTAKGTAFEAINLLVKGIEEVDELGFAVVVNTTGIALFIKVPQIGYVVTNLLSGTFPNYDPILEIGEVKTSVITKRAEFVQCLKSTKVIADIEKGIVELRLNPEGEGEFLASASDVGGNSGRFTATVTGQEVAIGLNASYLLQAVNAIDDPEIKLEVGSNANVVRLTIPGNKSYTHLLMPMSKVR